MKNLKARNLKTQARILLEGQYGFLALIAFILFMAQSFLNSIIEFAFPVHAASNTSLLYFACSLLSNILFVILLAGTYRIYLKLIRRQNPEKNDLFFAFSTQPEHTAIYGLIRFLLYYACSETLRWFLRVLTGTEQSFPIAVCFLILLIISIIALYLHLTFSMFLYLYCDAPWKKPSELLKESSQLMRGNCFRLLLLNLSFLGLSILGALSFGIGLLLIEPYINMATALFYEHLLQAEPRPSTEYDTET